MMFFIFHNLVDFILHTIITHCNKSPPVSHCFALYLDVTKKKKSVLFICTALCCCDEAEPDQSQVFSCEYRPSRSLILSGGGGDSGKASPLVPQPNPIFFLVIPLPLLNTTALSELSPHKLPLECQRQSNNRDGAVA